MAHNNYTFKLLVIFKNPRTRPKFLTLSERGAKDQI